MREVSASRLSGHEATGWMPVGHDRLDACPPAKLTGLAISPAARVEATRLAGIAEWQARALACQYGVCTPAWIHNCLVNLHLKQRGLCWQYMEDLRAALLVRRPIHHDLYFAVRDEHDLLFQHHCLVITAAGHPFDSGLVLDPWRHPGKLLILSARGGGTPWEPQVPVAHLP